MRARSAISEALSERPKLVSYDLAPDESVIDGLIAALDAIGYDLAEKEPPLIEFVNADALEDLRWKNPNLCVTTSVWQHPVLITADRITVYRARAELETD